MEHWEIQDVAAHIGVAESTITSYLARKLERAITDKAPFYLSVIAVRFVMAHMVAAATGKDQKGEEVHTLRS